MKRKIMTNVIKNDEEIEKSPQKKSKSSFQE
jgi:hypothetical protein